MVQRSLNLAHQTIFDPKQCMGSHIAGGNGVPVKVKDDKHCKRERKVL